MDTNTFHAILQAQNDLLLGEQRYAVNNHENYSAILQVYFDLLLGEQRYAVNNHEKL